MPGRLGQLEGVFGALKQRHGITRQDADMSSAEQIARLEAERGRPVTDLGDVGFDRCHRQGLRSHAGLQAQHLVASARLGQGCGRALGPGLHGHHRLRHQHPAREAAARTAGRRCSPASTGDGGRGGAPRRPMPPCCLPPALGGSETDLTPALKAFAAPLARGRLLQTNPRPR